MSGFSFPPLDGGMPPVAISGIGIEDFLLSLFAGIGAIGVACQFVPGLLLFISLLRSIFRYTQVDVSPSPGRGDTTH